MPSENSECLECVASRGAIDSPSSCKQALLVPLGWERWNIRSDSWIAKHRFVTQHHLLPGIIERTQLNSTGSMTAMTCNLLTEWSCILLQSLGVLMQESEFSFALLTLAAELKELEYNHSRFYDSEGCVSCGYSLVFQEISECICRGYWELRFPPFSAAEGSLTDGTHKFIARNTPPKPTDSSSPYSSSPAPFV
ncbi:hypothetical protein M405DRAFT_519438 [Rhizopogon salebrosus TDB-379]|nr:hypothetical protein M405DRAFT_519438 [Rhizopogon salebrosus TDB-379]